MSDNRLVHDNMPRPFDRKAERPEPRKQPLVGMLTNDEKDEAEGALATAGFETTSEGVRTLSLLFARDTRVREAVRQALDDLAAQQAVA